MTKSLIAKAGRQLNLQRPISFNSQWNIRGNNLYGSGPQDRFTQLQAMGGTGTLFAIVQLLSVGTSQHGWKLFRHNTDGRQRYSKHDLGSDERVEILPHKNQAAKLWNKPNPFMSGDQFREIGWQFMELVGEWYWVLNRGPNGTGIPLEIWPVRPDRMEPVPDRENFLAGWVYTSPDGEPIPLSVDEVIQVKYPHPSDPYRGMSAVQALLADIDAVKYSAEWTRNFFLNSATPGGIVQFAKRLTDDEFEEFTRRWREQHQGVARGHRVGILEQGAAWIPNTYTMRDMQFAELRNLGREVIREAYRIHQAMMGESTDVNRANAETAEEVHVAWHEVPRLRRMRSVLNYFYLDMFGASGQGVEFDYDDPQPSSANDANDELTAKSKAAQALKAAGWDADDVLETVGLPPMKYAVVGNPPPVGRPALPARGEEPEPQPKLGLGPTDLARGYTDEQVAAMSELIREAFTVRISNGHKELVA